jgi:sugar (pentulose or hexulose) kinase
MIDGDFMMGVDVGTSAVRVALLTSNGSVAASSRFQRSLVGNTTFDADQLWEDFVTCVKQLPDLLRRRPIRGISFAGHIGTVLIDGAGRPIQPSSLWSDPRGIDLLEAALARVPNAMTTAERPVPSGSSLARSSPPVVPDFGIFGLSTGLSRLVVWVAVDM